MTSIGTSATITSGNSYVDVTVPTLADNSVEGDETVSITITDGGSSYTALPTATASLTIADDPPVVSVSRLNDGQEGGADGTFRVSRSGGDISQSLAVTYTVSGSADEGDDYDSVSGTVTISASASYADVTIDVTDDGDTEGTETVTLTLDTDDGWVNGNASDTLFIWDDDGTFVQWTGANSDSWMDPDNWSGNAVPDGDDIVIFGGSYVDDVTLSGPLSPYSIGELRIASSYTGTITLSFPLSVGSLQMAGGTIDQPYSAYGSDLKVTAAAVWTGGVLNSTANAANVVFDGAVMAISASANELETGSQFEFLDCAAVIALSAKNDITFKNSQGVIASGSASISVGVFGLPSGVFEGNIKVDGGNVTIIGGTTANSLEVINGGTASIAGTFSIKGSDTSVEPVSAPGVTVNTAYAVLEAAGTFVELPNNNGA